MKTNTIILNTILVILILISALFFIAGGYFLYNGSIYTGIFIMLIHLILIVSNINFLRNYKTK